MASGLVCGFSCVVNRGLYVGCRLCYWKGGRCWYQSKCPARETIRRSDSDIDFWRSPSSVRSYRIPNFVKLIMECCKISHIFCIFLYIILMTMLDNFEEDIS